MIYYSSINNRYAFYLFFVNSVYSVSGYMSLIKSVENNWVDFHGILLEEYLYLNFEAVDENYNYTTHLKNHLLKGVISTLT